MKKIYLLICIMLFVGCATPTIDIRQYSGRPSATPSYTLQDLQDLGLEANFYYTAYQPIEDLDGSIQYEPYFLDMIEGDNDIDISIYKRVSFTLEIWNPKQIEYSLRETINIKRNTEPQKEQQGHELAKSNLKYRFYHVELPISEEVKEATYGVDLFVGDKKIMHFGDFHYEVQGARKEVKLQNTSY